MTGAARQGPLQIAGHLAAWVGLYFAGAYVIAVLLLGGAVRAEAVLASICAGVGLYLLDRVKLHDGLLDPADIASQPVRHAFLRAHAQRVRLLAFIAVVAGATLVATMHPLNLLVVAVGVGGILAYGADRAGVRLKDRLAIKNMLPGAAIASLAVILAAQSGGISPTERPGWLLVVLLSLAFVVSVDAAVCDLDDVESDLRSGTRTIPGVAGVSRTWQFAIIGHVTVTATLWVLAPPTLRTTPMLVGLLATTATIALALAPTRSKRDLVDLKLPLVAVLAWWLDQI